MLSFKEFRINYKEAGVPVEGEYGDSTGRRFGDKPLPTPAPQVSTPAPQPNNSQAAFQDFKDRLVDEFRSFVQQLKGDLVNKSKGGQRGMWDRVKNWWSNMWHGRYDPKNPYYHLNVYGDYLGRFSENSELFSMSLMEYRLLKEAANDLEELISERNWPYGRVRQQVQHKTKWRGKSPRNASPPKESRGEGNWRSTSTVPIVLYQIIDQWADDFENKIELLAGELFKKLTGGQLQPAQSKPTKASPAPPPEKKPELPKPPQEAIPEELPQEEIPEKPLEEPQDEVPEEEEMIEEPEEAEKRKEEEEEEKQDIKETRWKNEAGRIKYLQDNLEEGSLAWTWSDFSEKERKRFIDYGGGQAEVAIGKSQYGNKANSWLVPSDGGGGEVAPSQKYGTVEIPWIIRKHDPSGVYEYNPLWLIFAGKKKVYQKSSILRKQWRIEDVAGSENLQIGSERNAVLHFKIERPEQLKEAKERVRKRMLFLALGENYKDITGYDPNEKHGYASEYTQGPEEDPEEKGINQDVPEEPEGEDAEDPLPPDEINFDIEEIKQRFGKLNGRPSYLKGEIEKLDKLDTESANTLAAAIASKLAEAEFEQISQLWEKLSDELKERHEKERSEIESIIDQDEYDEESSRKITSFRDKLKEIAEGEESPEEPEEEDELYGHMRQHDDPEDNLDDLAGDWGFKEESVDHLSQLKRHYKVMLRERKEGCTPRPIRLEVDNLPLKERTAYYKSLLSCRG